jgi:hypothetical protein
MVPQGPPVFRAPCAAADATAHESDGSAANVWRLDETEVDSDEDRKNKSSDQPTSCTLIIFYYTSLHPR